MKTINTTETTAVVCFNFGSVATVGVTLYEGLTVDECIALRSEDIEEYKIQGGEWTKRQASAEEARQHLAALTNEDTAEEVTLAPAKAGCVWDEDGNVVEPKKDTMSYTITRNDRFNSIEIQFDGKPSEEVREALKALRFRWNRNRGIWYGFSTEEAARAAIEGKGTAGAQESAEAPKKARKADKKDAAEAQDHVRVYWNGIKIDGGKLIRCFYSVDNDCSVPGPCVSISARDYDHLPRDLFQVTNNTDIYTDYFDSDRATLEPSHPLYKYFRYAALKAQARMDRPYCEKIRETLNSGKREPWPGHYDSLRQDLARREKFLADFDAMTDPGQPTAEDLEKIDQARQEAENAREAAMHAEDLKRREEYLCRKVNGQQLIRSEQEAHPIQPDQPVVMINWSEHPAFYEYEEDGLMLSVAAAENILHQLDTDEINHPGYFKTSFTILGGTFEGEPINYDGRYDLGDGDGGLVQHIRTWGEWCRTHDQYGHDLDTPADSNSTTRFADFLAGFVA